MFEYLRGVVQSALPGVAVLEAGGFGYRVLVPLSTSSALKPGAEAKLLLHHQILAEQGEERLFGFSTERERGLFRALLDVQGVGPSTALNVMCAAGTDELIGHITRGDVAALKKLKGIGPKTAERLVTELRDKLAPWHTPTGAARPKPAQGQDSEDAMRALVALGYPPAKAEAAVAKATEALGKASTEELVRKALQVV